MSKIMAWCAGVAVAGAVVGCGLSAAAVRAAGSWGRAIEVPGLGALNKGADASDYTGVNSVSCARAGSCAAGGYYRDRHRHDQGFVAVEKNGIWGRAIEVPGLGALNQGGSAVVSSVSCARAGNCAAGGSYTDGGHHLQGFVAVEKNGVWGRAIEVPGLGALNQGADAADVTGVNSVSCASAGNCAAGGSYTDGGHHGQGFVADERHGVWGQAIEVPGLGALNNGGYAYVSAESCAQAGNCAAVGDYTDGGHHGQGFVAVERHGVWGQAIEVPGLGALNKGGDADVYAVSCASAGNCAAVGDYTDGGENGQGFVASERHGRWGKAIEVPGLGALNSGWSAEVNAVSCASAGNCAAAGTYGQPYGSGFVAVEKNGVWGKAIQVPGLAALNGRLGEATSVSCASPGNCAAVGDYSNASGGRTQGFVADERHGRWGKAIKVPGLAALNRGGGAYISEVSCVPDGSCAAGGLYADRRGRFQGFVVSQAG